jgi:radical SAM protein with 4Fe4S-binding SPASM domain
MIIVRGNTLPDYSLLSLKAGSAEIDGYQHHEKWQYKPIMGVNVDEISGENVLLLSAEEYEAALKRIGDSKLIFSQFNLEKTFYDGITILINTMTEAVISLTQAEYEVYANIEAAYSYADKLIVQLFLLGFLVKEDDSELFKLEVIRQRSAFASSDAINITIYPTQECNARCFYCFENGEKRTPMTLETAKKVVEYITKNITVNDEVVFRWFGGEPLVGAHIIDYITENVDTFFDGKLKFNSIVTTNGFNISDDLIEKATKKWHTKKFHLTIDGYDKEHNKRKNYYDKSINAYQKLLSDMRKLIDAGIFVVCRFNLDKKNISQLDDILHDLEQFKHSDLFYIHTTTLRRPPNAPLEDYILAQDYDWAYDIIWRKMYRYGFYDGIKHILPLRLRGNCLACVMNEVLINSDGNLFKCLQHTTDASHKVGDCTTGVVFNQNYLEWLDVSIKRENCQKCAYLPMCSGGCKEYWYENRPEISPCAREKTYFNTLTELIHEWITTGTITER